MSGKLVLIDGHSLAHRAFYAIRELRTAQGLPTNAIYGFTNMLLKAIEEEKPDHIAVAFDTPAPTFRHEAYEQYKGTRTGMHEDLRTQIPLIKEVVEAFGIRIYEVDGYEADDILGAAAVIGERDGLAVSIVTGDRDTLQLVSEDTTVVLTKRGITDTVRYDPSEMAIGLGLKPSQVADYKALVGDNSDNIPGVPGIGDKTATRLLGEYESIEEVLTNVQKLPKKMGEKILQNAEQMRLSKRLATIVTDVPLEINMEDCVYGGWDHERLASLFDRFEFRSLKKRLELVSDGARYDESRTLGVSYDTIENTDSAVDFFSDAAKDGGFSLYWQAGEPSVLQVSSVERTAMIRFGEEMADLPAFLARAKSVLEDPSVPKSGHGLKPFLVLAMREGLMPKGYVFDSEIAAYLLDPSRANYRLRDLLKEHLGLDVREAEEGWEARATDLLRSVLMARLEELGMAKLFGEIEMPLCLTLAKMESNGITVERVALRDMGKEFGAKIEDLQQRIYDIAGEEFNINSTKQLGEILFEKLKLPPLKKTKTGYSTDAETLERLAPRHEIGGLLLSYRQLVKLKGTYIDGLQELIDDETGKVHTTFNQTVTATGRLSSAEPNLQNIPIRQEVGRLIRKVFVPSEKGNVLVSADYSQIELRILAHISQDANMIDAFRRGQDIHSRTAAEVFGVELDAVDENMRQAAKAVNFGIVYGISDFGLATGLGISREQAHQYIQSYFERYPNVRVWIDDTIQKARDKGYVTTMLGRRRYLPDLNSRNAPLRQFAERTAMNTPIQGSAADLIKLAMVRIDANLTKAGARTKMLLQVHDELIFEMPEEEVALLLPMIKETMANCLEFDVPIVVDSKAGKNWCDLAEI